MAVVPLVCLALTGQRRDLAWWWLAGSFFVSWLADTAADILPHEYGWVPSLVYPVSQSAIIGAVLLPRRHAEYLLIVLVLACAAVTVFSGVGPEIALRALAWLSVVWIIWRRQELPQRLRVALTVYYGLGWCLWVVHVRWLVVATYYPYQINRLIGILLFCWATLQVTPRLRIERA